MPKLDGFKTTRIIRDPSAGTLNPKAAIISLTAHAVDGYRENYLNAGMSDYLSKPLLSLQRAI